MKERLKMIFDRIDIFVVCIVIGLCFCIVEAFLGIWNMFADCFFITLLATECCYILRCKEKLQIELIETKEKLKEAEKNANDNLLQLHQYSRYASLVCLYRNLWREKCRLAEAKVLYCKRKLTTSGLLEHMRIREENIADIEKRIQRNIVDFEKCIQRKK
ncbi:hypothetical protein [Segatella copri]|uniref:hypothetical protein n=1 Tax=Segatella copri TaxID=165179 RepID=UPI002230AAE7|nr:hypothetical protein [Segatella copri]MCW4124143.1 hypothetical protein [Segatella copri]